MFLEDLIHRQKDTAFFVIYFNDRQLMENCAHIHDTLEEAEICASSFSDPACIMDWVKDRDPQFSKIKHLLKIEIEVVEK